MAWVRVLCSASARAARHRAARARGTCGTLWPTPELGPPLSRLSSLLPLSPRRAAPTLAPPQFCYQLGSSSWAAVNRRCLSSKPLVELPAGEVREVPLAQTGEGIAECELLRWFVQEGDQVEEFQRLCEVQSDKATIEITSRFKGKVLQILFMPSDIVKVGETLLRMVVEENGTSLASEVLDTIKPLPPELHEVDSQSSPSDEEVANGVLSTPFVRHLAKQYGLNINDIHGTGKDGRVLKQDILKYAANKGICTEYVSPSSASTDEPTPPKEGKTLYRDILAECYSEDKRVPLRGFHRSMVKSMTMAARIPHFHYVDEINCDALVELKAAFQSENSDQGVKHTFLPFLIKSLSMALSKYPLLNSCFVKESDEVILKGSHNIGVAMATPCGLVVPNIKKVQSLSIAEITKELTRLQQMASNNKLSSEDITGGTITLSNIGTIGGKFGSPLLCLPEVAIIAMGRVQRLPRFANDGTVYPASVINVNIGADHRVLDGATVARFCNEWKLLIEKPELLLLRMR